LGVDPRTSASEFGIMTLPKENLNKCFHNLAIAKVMKGSTDYWIDGLDMDEQFHPYFFTIPDPKDGDITLTVETY